MKQTIFLPRHGARLLLAAVVMLSSACSTLQPHPPAPSDVTVRFVGLPGRTAFCTEAGRYATTRFLDEGFRAVKFPVGKRVTLWHSMTFSGHNAYSTCDPALSFVPVEGKQYVVNASVSNGACYIELVAQDSQAESGVALDRSVQAPSC